MRSSSAGGTTAWSPPRTWPAAAGHAGVRAPRRDQRRGGQRASVRAWLHGHVAVVHGAAAAADLVRDLRLERHGITCTPRPVLRPRADGQYLRLPPDRPPGAPRSPGSPPRTPARTTVSGRLAQIERLPRPAAGPVHRTSARAAGRPVGAGPAAGAVGGRRTRLSGRDPLLTGSIADLLDRYFESDAVHGLLSVSGVIGPRQAAVSRTAYVMLHRHVGEADGRPGASGFPRGGIGRVSRAIAAAARAFGADIRTGAEVARIRTRDGRVCGVTLASGEEIDADVVITTAHPQISFLR